MLAPAPHSTSGGPRSSRRPAADRLIVYPVVDGRGEAQGRSSLSTVQLLSALLSRAAPRLFSAAAFTSFLASWRYFRFKHQQHGRIERRDFFGIRLEQQTASFGGAGDWKVDHG